MRTLNTLLRKVSLTSLLVLPLAGLAQQAQIDNLRAYDKSGILFIVKIIISFNL